jgi:hypothetical protein
MSAISSITALGRLLRDGSLRDLYGVQPEETIRKLNVIESEIAPLLNLDTEDLEAQAEVLLRKRYASVRRWIPQTCEDLGNVAWPFFLEYGRCSWLSTGDSALEDADRFCAHLLTEHGCAVALCEKNRIAFCLGKKTFAIHLVTRLFVRNKRRAGIQVLLRRRGSSVSEYVLYFSLG